MNGIVFAVPDGSGYVISGSKVFEIDARSKRIRNEVGTSN